MKKQKATVFLGSAIGWITLLILLLFLGCGEGGELDGRQSQVDGSAGPKGTDVRRTVVLIHGPTEPGQALFVRGGLDHALAKKLLDQKCTSSNRACAIPIQHRNLGNEGTRAWKDGDSALDWYGREEGQDGANQGALAEGTPLDWTTNDWPAFWGPVRTVEADGYGLTPLNRFGAHYWMLDVDMDCGRALPAGDGAWFEMKTLLSGGSGWEDDIDQPGAPFPSVNHVARCGMLNIFQLNRGEAHILPLEIGESVSLAGAADIAFSNEGDRKSTRLNSSHTRLSRMPSSA